MLKKPQVSASSSTVTVKVESDYCYFAPFFFPFYFWASFLGFLIMLYLFMVLYVGLVSIDHGLAHTDHLVSS